MHRMLLCLAAAALLAACERTPEAAKKSLAARKVEVTGESLIKQTRRTDSAVARDLVIAGADPNARTPRGWTALMSAAYNGQADTVKLLIEKGADVNAQARGYSVLSAAVFSGKPEIVRMLLKAGADPNAGASKPLGAARSINNEAMIRLLTDAGARG